MKPGLIVTRVLPEAVQKRAATDYDARFLAMEGTFDAAAFLGRLDGATAALVTPADKVDARTIECFPDSVKVLATFSVGTDHLDLDAAKAKGVVVVNTPDVLSFATAELALTLMLMAARRAGEGERIVRANAWPGWTPTYLLGTSLEGKTLGVLGMGRIGKALAKMAQGLSMKVIYHNRRRLPPEQESMATYVADEDDFLGASDVLSIHLPGGSATKHWLNAERIDRLPQGAIVINTGRGSTVDDEALIAALARDRVGAAGLDVFAAEPSVPEGYLGLENVVLLPHLGSATRETRTAMGMLALDGIDAVLADGNPANRVV